MMIQELTKTEVNECLNDLKRIGIHGLKGVEIKQCVQLLDEVRTRKDREVKTAIDLMKSNIGYSYPNEYKNGSEFDFWLEKLPNYDNLGRIEKILTDHLNPDSKINEQPEPNIPKKRGIGRPKATSGCLEDLLIDPTKYSCIIDSIKEEYKNKTLRDIFYLVLVLSKKKIFDEKKTIGNITNLNTVILKVFEKGDRSNLNNLKSEIYSDRKLEIDEKFAEHKEIVNKILTMHGFQ